MENSEHYFEIRPKNSFGLDLKELITHKELFYFFTWRDIKVKYKQTALGFLWAVLQPVLLMVIFGLFIGKSFDDTVDEMKYPVYVFSGLLLWLVFSSGITNAGNSMVSNAQIIKKIYFPRLIIPISSILVAVFDFLMAFLVFVPLLIFFDQPVDITKAILLWPIAVVLTIFSTLGPGCLLAALNVKYRDFRYVIPFLVQALLFVTPVIYSITNLKYKWLHYLVAVNPMYSAITIFRMPLTGVAPDPLYTTISLISTFFFLIMGIIYFKQTEMYFADLT